MKNANAIAREELRKRIVGCWCGKCMGGALGARREGREGPPSPAPHGSCVTPNEDLALQAAQLEALRGTGGFVSCRTLAGVWLDHAASRPAGCGMDFLTMRRSLWPPFSGFFGHASRDGAGRAIRAELWACLAPGDPDRAAALAEADGCLDRAGDALHAVRFLAALESLAFVERDQEALLDAALARIPWDCRLARAISDTRRRWGETGDLAETRRIILAGRDPEKERDAVADFALLVLGWLAGGGDFGSSLCAAVTCGHDAVCAGATLGALFGILDPDGIPENGNASAGDAQALPPGLAGMCSPPDVEQMADEILALAPRIRLSATPFPASSALVADFPLRVEAFYPEESGCVFAPGATASLRVRVVNSTDGMIPLEVRFAAPSGWAMERSGTDVEHAFSPGEAHEETLALTAPQDPPGTPGPSRGGALIAQLRSGCLAWTVPIGLPQPVPCLLDDRRCGC